MNIAEIASRRHTCKAFDSSRKIDSHTLEQMKAFAVSDKPFRENTPNPIIGENPMPLRHENLNSSIRELEAEIQFFKKIYESNPKLTAQNPFFGEMNFQEWVALFYKHANHHLKHFGLINQD